MKLIKWDQLKHQIEQSRDLQELSGLRDQLEAFRILARQSKQSLETQNKITEYRLRVDRKIGEFSMDLPTAQGERTDLTSSTEATKSEALKETGITKQTASKYEAIASIPEEEFEKHLKETKESSGEITTEDEKTGPRV